MKIKITIENFTISTKLSKSIQVKDLLKQIKNSKIINSNGDEFKLLDNNYIILEETEFLKVPEEKIENKSNEKSTLQKNSFFINSNKSNNINDNNNNKQFFQKPEEDTRFYLIKYPKLNNKKYSDPEDFKTANAKSSHKKVDIEDLIMKTTNAKAKIDTSIFKHTELSSAERLNLIDELINSSLENIMGEIPNAPLQRNISQGSQNISQLLSILRPIIGSDMSEGDYVINRSRGPGSIIINRAGYSRAPLAPDESLVNNLKEMGFPEEQCHRALVMGRNNISRATDLLLSGDLDYLPSEK